MLLEPIMNVDITVPEENMGDIIGDLNSRRARGWAPAARQQHVVGAEVPLAEMYRYWADLAFHDPGPWLLYRMEFLRYERMPAYTQAADREQLRSRRREEAQKG